MLPLNQSSYDRTLMTYETYPSFALTLSSDLTLKDKHSKGQGQGEPARVGLVICLSNGSLFCVSLRHGVI